MFFVFSLIFLSLLDFISFLPECLRIFLEVVKDTTIVCLSDSDSGLELALKVTFNGFTMHLLFRCKTFRQTVADATLLFI